MRRITAMYDELHEFYSRIKPEMGEYAMGARILMSRPIFQPRVMFIAYQPGQSKGFESPCNCDETWPENNEYAMCDWPLARKIRGAVEDEDKKVLENDTVITNVNFFRARTVDAWEKVPINPRRKAEEFSLERVYLLIEELQPRAIFAIGFSVFDVLVPKQHQDVLHTRESKSGKIERVVGSGMVAGRQVIGALHLSGAQMKKADRAKIGASLKKLFES